MQLKLFSFGDDHNTFAKRIAMYLDLPLCTHAYRMHPDGEFYLRSDHNVREMDVYVIAHLYGDDVAPDGSGSRPGEKMWNLLLFLGSLRDASAGRVTVVAPYLPYARQDRKTESRAPIATKYLGRMLSHYCDRFLTMDVHNITALQNGFDCPTDNLEARNLAVDYFVGGKDRNGLEITDHIREPLREHSDDIVVMSPDVNGSKRAEKLRDKVEARLRSETGRDPHLDIVVFDKRRDPDGTVRGSRAGAGAIIGNVEGKRVLMVDDMMATCGTVDLASKAVEEAGGRVWAIFATHGLFLGSAAEKLARVENVVVTDTVPPFRLNGEIRDKLWVIDTSRMFAQAIKRTHEGGGSISELLS